MSTRGCGANRPRIMVAGEDDGVRKYLIWALGAVGYLPQPLRCLRETALYVKRDSPHLVLLHLDEKNAPRTSIVREVRALRSTRIIVLSMAEPEARASTAVRYLDAGADDFVLIPFAIGELLMRIRAVLSRSAASGFNASPLVPFEEDVPAGVVVTKRDGGGAMPPLSIDECKAFRELAAHRGEAVTVDRLLDSIWGEGGDRSYKRLQEVMNGLRRKLGDDVRSPAIVESVWGVGYRMPKDASRSIAPFLRRA